MNRLIHIPAIILLLLSTTGVTISKHYCGDILKNIAINTEPEHCCEEDEMPMGCCHDEAQHYSLDDDLRLQQYDLKLDPPSIAYLISYCTVLVETHNDDFENQHLNFVFKSPPRAEPDIYISVQSFLI